MPLLDSIDGPEALRRLTIREQMQLADELRDEILRVVAANGGHLASSLGAVELTIALHSVFDTPRDALIWDVGHQAYAHKLLTGRRELFSTLRRFGGCAPFQSRAESPESDPIGGGHAGTAISAALGLQTAWRRKGEWHRRAVAVVGDGALACGLSLEALNQLADRGVPLVIVLNDNRMSISHNVGGLTRYLNRLLTARHYRGFKEMLRSMLGRRPGLLRRIRRLEEAVKGLLLPGGWFEALGIRYLGPVDGHSIPDLIRALATARDSYKPVLVHVVTRKGMGYTLAEEQPDRYHGVPPFDPVAGLPETPAKMSFSRAFGDTLCELAEKYPELAAITAAMKDGTGLSEFAERYPKRFFDTGITEAHAAVFAAGLAAAGMRPVMAVYATFFQRALDPLYHDICLQKLPVIFALDRSGAVEDGPTHHGIYDLAFLLEMPGLTVYAPLDEAELRAMLHAAVKAAAPAVIRYPRGGTGRPFDPAAPVPEIAPGSSELMREGGDCAIAVCGPESLDALRTAEILAERHGIRAAVLRFLTLKPFDAAALREQAARKPVFTLEDHAATGGLGRLAASALAGMTAPRALFGWPDGVLPHGAPAELRRQYGLDPESLAASIAAELRRG